MDERQRKRLEMARALLQVDPSMTPGQVLTLIREKERKEQDSLKSVVDWLEDYERHEWHPDE